MNGCFTETCPSYYGLAGNAVSLTDEKRRLQLVLLLRVFEHQHYGDIISYDL